MPLRQRESRLIQLPVQEIEAALQGLDGNGIDIVEFGGCGDFLCEYMAYHDSWYVDWTQSEARLEDVDIHQKAEAGGFTHIGLYVDHVVGREAVDLQLKEVIKFLETNY